MQKPEGVKYWSLPAEDVLRAFDSTITGLTTAKADSRLKMYGQNAIEAQRKTSPLLLFFSQFKNPIIIILIVATAISALTGSLYDSLIILLIILGSAVLSFFQEYSAGHAAKGAPLQDTAQIHRAAGWEAVGICLQRGRARRSRNRQSSSK